MHDQQARTNRGCLRLGASGEVRSRGTVARGALEVAKGIVDEPATASIAAATLQDHRAIAREMAAQIVGEIATYREANNSHELLRATEDSCDAHIQSFCQSVLDRLGPEELEIGFTAESVADRVRQGIPLESILHAYRIGHRVLWATLEERAATAGEDRVAIVPLVAPSIRYIDAVSTMVAEIYLREQQHELVQCLSFDLLVGRGWHARGVPFRGSARRWRSR